MRDKPMTKQQMQDRIRLLSDEIDANEEENRVMQEEDQRHLPALLTGARPRAPRIPLLKGASKPCPNLEIERSGS